MAAASPTFSSTHPLGTDSAFFPEETCALTDLKARSMELKSNYYEKGCALSEKIERVFKQNVGKDHDFSANLCSRRMVNRPADEMTINANDVHLGAHGNFILFACPKDVVEASIFFDAALQKGTSVFISLLESTEAQDKFNNYWTEEKLSQIKTHDGWTFSVVEKKVLDKAEKTALCTKEPIVIETTIEAKNANGERRILTHLHYEGWPDREVMPSERLLHVILDRVGELQQGKTEPVAINCHGGVGRTGTTAISLFLRKAVDEQLALGIRLDKVKINIPQLVYDFRKQRNGFLGQATQLANVFSLAGDYVQSKEKPRHGSQWVEDTFDIRSNGSSTSNIEAEEAFSDEGCSLGDLASKIEQLAANKTDGFSALADKIKFRFRRYLKRLEFDGKKHNFSANLAKHRMSTPPQDGKLNANDVVMGPNGRYLLHACPMTCAEAAGLIDAALQSNSVLFVSTLKSGDAHDRFNNFWEASKASQIVTNGGWTIRSQSSSVIAQHGEVKLIRTLLEAARGEETKPFVHLHYDGWDQDRSMPNQTLFQELLDHIDTIQEKTEAPFAIHSKWGVGRNGTLAVSHYLRRQVTEQRENGVPLEKIRVNIPQAIFEFRKQRNGFVEHAPLIQDVYAILAGYYRRFK